MSCEQFMDGEDKSQAKKYAKNAMESKVYINIFCIPI